MVRSIKQTRETSLIKQGNMTPIRLLRRIKVETFQMKSIENLLTQPLKQTLINSEILISSKKPMEMKLFISSKIS
nr:MAG TPA: hypothetical protein [Caudoviricetes sp.]